MSRKSVLLSRLGCGLVFLLCAFPALDAGAALSFAPSSVTGTIHYTPTPPTLAITAPVAATVNTPNLTLAGSLSTTGNLSINGVNVPLSPGHAFNYPVTLTEGANNFVFLGVDLGGNRVTQTKNITLDTVPPTIPNATLISVAVAGGQATLIGDPGSVNADTQITVTDLTSGASITVTSDANGAFTATLAVQTGDQLTIVASDEAGNVSSAMDVTIGANTAAPSVPNLGLISASAVANGMTTITGAPGAVDPTIQVTITNQTSGASVAFTSTFSGAFPVPEVLAAVPGSVFKITAKDAAGNTAVAMIQVPGLHSTPPIITLTPQLPSITYATTTTYTVTGTVSEPANLYLSGTQVIVPLRPDLSFSYTVTLQQGNNEVGFIAVDNQGNNTVTPFYDIYLGSIPPTVTITSSQFTGQQSFTITGTVAGANFSLDPTSTVTVNGVSATVSFASGSFRFSSSPVSLVEGENDITVVATDNRGNQTTLTVPVYLNSGAPSVIVTSPSFTNQNPYTLTGQLTKEGTLTVNGQPVNLQSDLSFSYTLPPFPQDGSYPLTLVVTDLSSNQVTQTETVTLDTTSPNITLITPQGPFTNQANLTLTGNLSEAGTLTINGNPVMVGPGPDFSFSYPLTLAEGNNDIQLFASDAAGNGDGLDWSINLDTTSPIINVPLLTATDVLDGNGNPIGEATISGSPSAIDNSPNPDSDVTLTLSGVATGQSTSVNLDGDGEFNATLSASAEDPFNITAVDGAGNVSGMRVQLGNACYSGTQNAMLTVNAGSGTITGAQGSTAVFHVTRTGPLGFDTYVDYLTADGTAASGTDYTGGTGSFKIPAGAASADLSIPLSGSTDPSLSGTTKTFTLQILGVHNPITGGASSRSSGFAPRDVYPVGNSPWSGTTTDLNGDGKPDVITANNSDPAGDTTGPGYVSILLNTTPAGATQESLAAQQTLTAGLGTSFVAAADVNGDGKPDLIVTNAGDNTVMVFLNTTPVGSSTVSFAPPLVLPTGTSPESVVVADLNGDGKPDIVVGNDAPDNSVTVYFNTTPVGAAAASFAAPQTFAAGPGAKWDLVIADVNGDGLPDVVVTNDGVAGDGSDSGVSVLLNTTAVGAATPSFAPLQTYPVAGYVSFVAVADFNGDGILDLAATSESQNAVVILTNQTTRGGMTLSFAPAQILAVGASTDSAAAADVDGDGKIDLIVADTGSNSISVLRNTTAPDAATPSFGAPVIYGSGNEPWPVLLADLNADGYPDIISVDESDNTVSVLMNLMGVTVPVDYGSCVMPASVTGTINYGLVPSAITITSPVGTSFESPYQVLSGSVSSVGGPSTLTVNGASVPVNADGAFSMYITLQPGANTYQLTATSAGGVAATQTVTLTLNSPSLPAPGATAIQFQPGGSGQVTVTGAAPSGATEVTVFDITDGNSMSGPVDGNGNFSVTLTGNLSDSFSVSFNDASGDQSAPVFMQGNDPALNINVTSPCSGAACSSPVTVNGSMVSIAGNFTGPVGTGITVNGGVVQLSDGSFYVNNLPLTPGSNTITIVATTPGGLSATQTLTIDSAGSTSLLLRAIPSDKGTAPFTVGFAYSFLGTATISDVKMSYLGNGSDDVDSDNPGDVTLSYVYNTPGVYPATLTLVDTDGTPYVATLNVVVQDPSLDDAARRKIWQTFVAALVARDRAAAMNCLDYEAQQKFAPVVDTLLDQMPQIAGSFSNLFSGVSSGDRVEYTVVRTIAGQAQVFFVYFIQDNDGVWRVDAM